jgi:histidinol-phosphate aminotransferase
MSDWLHARFIGDDAGVSARWRRRSTEQVNLANNEMRHPALAPQIAEAIGSLPARAWTAYPDYALERERYGGQLGVSPGHLLFTAGSDQAYRAVLQAFAAPGRALLTQRPNYDQILPYAALTGFTVHGVDYRPGEGFAVDEFLAAIRRLSPGSIVAVSNPNGPTGAWWPAADLSVLVEACARHQHLLVLDEAYAAYAPTQAFRQARQWPHVIIVRSFSKEFGLAGTRLAVCVCGSTRVADYLQRWNLTNPVSGPALHIGRELAASTGAFAAIHAELNESRRRLSAELPALMGGLAEPSEGNFVPVRCASPEAAAHWVAALSRCGYAIRHLAMFGLPRHLRVSAADGRTVDDLLARVRAVAESQLAGEVAS